MLDFLRGGNAARKSETFAELTIERRVLITPSSTIAIANIALIAAGTIKVTSRRMLAIALGLLVAGALCITIAYNLKNATLVVLGAALLGGGVIIALFFLKANKPALLVTTNDGFTSRFAGQQCTLVEVRRLLTDKINAHDERAAYRINFEKGAIQALSIGHVDQVGAVVAGSNNQVMAGAGGARIGTADSYLHATNSAGAQLGNGHYAAHNGYHADYSQLLPQIVDMQRFYAARQDTHDIADRLGEVERLMRSGTPTAGSRGRLGQLLGDLTSILGAYPGVVQVFQQVGRLAGF